MSKKVLITGGSGYFGEVLVKKLLERGNECRILDINAPDKSIFNDVNFINADIRDFDAVRDACKNIDFVFHNVAQVPLAKNKKLFDSVNITGSKNIIDACIKEGVEHLSYTSSSAIYGVPENNPVSEQTQPWPMESYGFAKLKGELLCKNVENNILPISIIRPRTILGAGRLGIFQILFEWIYQNYNVPVFDGGNNQYQFIHAKDLADACISAAEIGNSETYNIGASEFGTMNELLSFLIKSVNSESHVKSLNSNLVIPFMKIFSTLRLSPLGPYHAMMYGKSMYFDTQKAQRELNWKPKYSNNMMVLESYKNYIWSRNEILQNNLVKSKHKSYVKQGILSLVGRLL